MSSMHDAATVDAYGKFSAGILLLELDEKKLLNRPRLADVVAFEKGLLSYRASERPPAMLLPARIARPGRVTVAGKKRSLLDAAVVVVESKRRTMLMYRMLGNLIWQEGKEEGKLPSGIESGDEPGLSGSHFLQHRLSSYSGRAYIRGAPTTCASPTLARTRAAFD